MYINTQHSQPRKPQMIFFCEIPNIIIYIYMYIYIYI